MTSNYNVFYSRFLAKITDYNQMELNENDVYAFMNEWIHSTLARPYIRRLFSSVSADDEIMELTYELSNPINNNADEDFIIEVVSSGMVIEWLEPQVKSVLNISQMFGGKEQKFYAQANHLNELKSMLKDCKTELRKMIRDRGYINNSYIDGD